MEGVATVPLTDQQLVMVVPKTFTDRLFGGQAEEVRKQFSQGADIRSSRHQLAEHGGVGQGEQVHPRRAVGGGRDGPEEKLRADGHPVDFSLYEGNSNQLEDELSHGRVDLVICFQPIGQMVTPMPAWAMARVVTVFSVSKISWGLKKYRLKY